jgi:hypothetical protein
VILTELRHPHLKELRRVNFIDFDSSTFVNQIAGEITFAQNNSIATESLNQGKAGSMTSGRIYWLGE